MNVVLAVDVAKTSGWCITDAEGQWAMSGEVDAFSQDVIDICRLALQMDRKAVIALETPSHGNRATLVGLGAARGCWISAWKNATGLKTTPRLKNVYPATWRSELFGNTSKFPTQERLSASMFSGKQSVGPDEAAACCIARYAVLKMVALANA